jgi:urease accessory protein
MTITSILMRLLMTRLVLRSLVAAAALIPSIALAHPGHGDGGGFVHGLLHPVTGLDHVLAMVAVGMLAAHLGGRALLWVPASFLAMMVVGGALGMMAFPIPQVETGIALSVIVLGLAVAFRLNLPTAVAAGLPGAFAIFHGYAHGAEMPAAASLISYGAGFLAATALLHLAGIGLGLLVGRAGVTAAPRIARLGGGAMALAGIALVAGSL